MDLAKEFQASDFSEEQIAEFREAFCMFDKRGEGEIPVQDLQSLFQSMGQSIMPSDIARLLNSWDIDKDGMIDFPEFLNILSSQLSGVDNEEFLLEAFRVFDADDSGYITADELKKVMGSMGERMTSSDVEEMIHQADMDGDGMINFEEFVRLLLIRK